MMYSRLFVFFVLIVTFACKDKTVEQPPPARNNVILISIDTTRADAIGAYGNSKIKTPSIDSVATEGALFTQAIAHVPLTLPSHASLLTGLLPAKHGIHDNNGYRLGPETTTLAESFKNDGYQTAAFISSIVLDHRFGLDQGFDYYDDHIQYGSTESENKQNERIAEQTANHVISWLSNHLNSPFFLFVHFYDPHAKYSAPEPFRSQFSDSYYGEIAYVDSQISRILASIKTVDDRTFVLITSDHGEGLGEHGELGHGLFLYDSTVRVPMILKGPQISRNLKIQTQVRLVDVAPTLIDLASTRPLLDIDGRSLKPLFQGSKWEEIPAIIETQYPLQIGWSPLVGSRSTQWKMIDAPQPELYELPLDPSEQQNIISERKAIAHEISSRISRYKTESQQNEKPAEKDPELEEQLRSLGYLSGSSKPVDRANLPDPKSMIEVWKLYEQSTYAAMDGNKSKAMDLLNRAILLDDQNAVLLDTLAQFQVDSDLDAAINNWKRALKIRPDDARMHHRLALGLKRAGQVDLSLQEEKLALKIDPEMTEALLGMADLLMEMRKPNEAIQPLQQLLQIDPKNAPASYQLASAYQQTGDMVKAAEHYENAIRFNPALPYPYYGLGILKGLTGDLNGAEMLLKKTIEIDAGFTEAYFNLGVIYERTGRPAEAAQAYQQFVTRADRTIHAARIESARQKLKTLM